MEVFFSKYWIVIMAAIISFVVGFAIGRIRRKQKSDGQIFVEPTEETDRERIRFVLNIELDDIVKKQQILFDVKNMRSQNSQSI